MKNKMLMVATTAALLLAPQAAMAGKEAAVIAAPPAGKGQVVFYRPGSLMGAAIRCTVRRDGAMIGRSNNGKYFVYVTDPGTAKFTTATEATDTINLEVEADETQYVRCKIGMGVMAGRPNLIPSTKEEFDTKSTKVKLVDPAEMAKDIADDSAEKAAKK